MIACRSNKRGSAPDHDFDVQRVRLPSGHRPVPAGCRVYHNLSERLYRWAADRGAQLMPSDPAAVAAYLAVRAEQLSNPAVVRRDRASMHVPNCLSLSTGR